LSDGLQTFALACQPDVTIGAVDGDVPCNLSGVTDAIRLSDGTIVVADGSSGQVRYFDGNGRLRSVGQRGRGPEEFQWLRRIFLVGGDTLAACDPFQFRITVFAPDGALVRTFVTGRVDSAVSN
jgi:hypothetical protein